MMLIIKGKPSITADVISISLMWHEISINSSSKKTLSTITNFPAYLCHIYNRICIHISKSKLSQKLLIIMIKISNLRNPRAYGVRKEAWNN